MRIEVDERAVELLLHIDAQRERPIYGTVFVSPAEWERLAIRHGHDPHRDGNWTLFGRPVVVEHPLEKGLE